MINPEVLFGLANIAYVTGTLLLTRKVLNNRESIKDYDFLGSSLTMTGLFFSVAGQFALNYYYVVLTTLPTLAFWILVSVLSFKNRSHNNAS